MHRQGMERPRLLRLCVVLLMALLANRGWALAPSAADNAAFDRYTQSVEARLAMQHQSSSSFLQFPADPKLRARLLRGEVLLERLSPSDQPASAMLHHWRATAFVPRATSKGFQAVLSDFEAYPHVFAPQLLRDRVLSQQPLQVELRMRQRHGITVVLDETCDVSFGRLDPDRSYSSSRSVRIHEVASPGTASEHWLSDEQQVGFLWRQNTYWSAEQREDGLYLQVESVSLTRPIPFGLAWAVRPYIESIPRESLAFVMDSVRTALRQS